MTTPDLDPHLDDEIPSYQAYGMSIAEVDLSKMPEANRLRALAMKKMREIAERA